MKKAIAGIILGLTALSLSAQANYWPLSALDFKTAGNLRTADIEPGYNGMRISQMIQEGRWGYHPLNFYPVGWSDDGKFAYVMMESFSERGGWRPPVELCIMDMVSDEIVYRKRVDAEEDLDMEAAQSNADRAGTVRASEDPLVGVYANWRMFASEFEEKMTEFRIGKIESADFLTFPLLLGGRTYEARPYGTQADDGETYKRYFSEYGLRIERGTQGRKTIFEGQGAWDQNSPVIGITVFGAFKSPYENRIAVLYGVWDTGWEGTPWLDLHLSGSHLGVGFQ